MRNSKNIHKKTGVLHSYFMVHLKGLEPPRLSALDPKSSASASFATSAWCSVGDSNPRPSD